MEYKFTINDFEGPLDLLLHLIKQANINIYDINIEEIAIQYLNFINSKENINLNIASEYLIMAAELMEIKSKMLLPKQKYENIDEEIDPKENLINKLLEYNKYKNIIPQFQELKSERNNIYTKNPDDLTDLEKEVIVNESSDLNLLIEALNKFLSTQKLKQPLNTTITKKEYSIAKRNLEIKNILKIKKSVNFLELFDIITKEYIVITFLSILDLAKKNEIIIEQAKNFNTILLKDIEVKA
ncbi:MAG: segregation/condensation protein A [Bacilli bacterium]|nr:segregation/condensation protein A [Bacilli bacterium]